MLASFLNAFREVIEAAETPFAKLAVFVLPIVAPFVPAIITGMRLYILFENTLGNSTDLIRKFNLFASVITALALELFGYVGAIMFIRNVHRLVRHYRDEGWLPVVLTGGAYAFYIVAMLFINIELSNGVPNPVKVFGLLSLMSIPAGMLFADNLSQKEEDSESFQLRQERRKDAMERYRIAHQQGETFQKISRKKRKVSESSQKVSGNLSSDWRKVRPLLSVDDIRLIAKMDAAALAQFAQDNGKSIRTVSNWRSYANEELRQLGE